MRAFDVDNPVWSTLAKIVDVIMLNLFFVIGCIPIITIGTSCTALCYTAMRMVSGNLTYVGKDFWDSYKSNFKQSLAIEMIVFDVGVILAFFTWIANLRGMYVGRVVMIVLSVMYVAVVMYVFPSLAKFETDTKTLFRNCALMAVAHFPYTILNLVLWGVVVVAAYQSPLAAIALFACFGFATILLIQSLWFNRIFARYMSESDLEQAATFKEEERAAKAEKKAHEARQKANH